MSSVPQAVSLAAASTERLPPVATTAAELRAAIAAARGAGKRVGVVPTMGALHAGHLSLVDAAARECGFVVVTIFVNPTQFGPQEDFARYPRSLEADLAALAPRGVDLVFVPSQEEMYPPGYSTFVEPPDAAQPWEGRCRPGHFRGVTTIVLKLLNVVAADAAYFGQKDFQQALVIRRMVEDLDVPVAIRVLPIVREPDGLAMSSRNRYLSAAERQQALALSRSLRLSEELYAQGERDAADIAARMRQVLAAAGIAQIDYIALADPHTLAELRQLDRPAVALIAAWVGKTRLIDNCLLGEK